jgi:hypothetical protein
MYENINEQVQVIAIFGDEYKKIRPFKMQWHDKDYLISEVGYLRKQKEGKATWHVFSVTDGANFFELMFNSESLVWMLGRVSDNESH